MLGWTACAALAAFQGSALVNGDFEAKAPAADEIAGWKVEIGARNGGIEPLSGLALDASVKRQGKQSLRLSGDSSTRAWRFVSQEVDVRPGARCRLRAFVKTDGVRQEKVDGKIPQFLNCYVALFALDRAGQVVAKELRTPKQPRDDWRELSVELTVPETSRRVRAATFLSMSGTMWIDDVRLDASGGSAPPVAEAVFSEGFENADAVPSEWKEEMGARNGEGPTRTEISIDRNVGAPGSPRSLALRGDAGTIFWYALRRAFPAAAGDVVRLRAQARARDVHKEGIQFPNFHAHVFFRDAAGKDLAPARFAHPGTGTYEWKAVEVENTAPEGAAEAVVGVFLSMSGHVWLDRIEVTRERGGPPPMADWSTLETRHLTLRYPKDHPLAATMADYGKRLDETFEQICKRAAVKFEERITAYLYRDAAQGKAITGRDLAFAEPDGREFHQGPDNTLGHEMAHVILRKAGYAQVPLLGEGIAVYLDGAPASAHHGRAAALLAEGKLPSLQDLLGRFRDLSAGYPAAGSFCGFLVETYGIERFKRLYVAVDPAAAAKAALGATLAEADARWRATLGRPK